MARNENIRKLTQLARQIVPDRKPTSPSSQAQDATLGEQLWKLSSDLLSKKLGSLPYEL